MCWKVVTENSAQTHSFPFGELFFLIQFTLLMGDFCLYWQVLLQPLQEWVWRSVWRWDVASSTVSPRKLWAAWNSNLDGSYGQQEFVRSVYHPLMRRVHQMVCWAINYQLPINNNYLSHLSIHYQVKHAGELVHRCIGHHGQTQLPSFSYAHAFMRWWAATRMYGDHQWINQDNPESTESLQQPLGWSELLQQRNKRPSSNPQRWFLSGETSTQRYLSRIYSDLVRIPCPPSTLEVPVGWEECHRQRPSPSSIRPHEGFAVFRYSWRSWLGHGEGAERRNCGQVKWQSLNCDIFY